MKKTYDRLSTLSPVTRMADLDYLCENRARHRFLHGFVWGVIVGCVVGMTALYFLT